MPVELHGVFYTIDEAAARLGYASKSTLAADIQKGRVPAVRVGRFWLVPESVVEALDQKEINGQGNRGVTRK
ncbi:helix-turn-helix domain-containing protein [Desulfovibrio piger]|nr:helix-turn-helix domain-containing protein [Desulfovibrio piger]